MNIYFAWSIAGGREFEPAYQAILASLLADGHTLPIITWLVLAFIVNIITNSV